MKKLSLGVSCVVVALALAFLADASAGQGGRQETAQAGSALEASLDELESALKKSVAVDTRQRYVRRTYTRLKRGGGCNVSFLISQVPGASLVSQPDLPVEDLSRDVWKVDLSGLAQGGVTVEKPAKGGYGVVRFAALGGKEAIKRESLRVASSGWASEGRIYVGEKEAPAVAAALEGAINACRK